MKDPAKRRQENKLTIQVIGACMTVAGLFALGQHGNSILILGLIVGPFLLIAPDMFLG